MEEKASDHDDVEDDVLRAKEFRRGGGIDLGQFMIQDVEEEVEEAEEVLEQDVDEAVGEMASFFQGKDEQSNDAGSINRDGTVDEASAPDSVTDMAVHGERRLGFGLLAGMVLVWSVLGWVVGTALPPTLEALCSSSWDCLVFGLERNGFPIQPCISSVSHGSLFR